MWPDVNQLLFVVMPRPTTPALIDITTWHHHSHRHGHWITTRTVPHRTYKKLLHIPWYPAGHRWSTSLFSLKGVLTHLLTHLLCHTVKRLFVSFILEMAISNSLALLWIASIEPFDLCMLFSGCFAACFSHVWIFSFAWITLSAWSINHLPVLWILSLPSSAA